MPGRIEPGSIYWIESVGSRGPVLWGKLGESAPVGLPLDESSLALLAEVMPAWMFASVKGALDVIVLESASASAEVPAGSEAERSWVARNRLMTALLLVVLVVMSEPAYARLLPPEVHAFLREEEGPAAFCLALVAAVTAAMAVNHSRKK